MVPVVCAGISRLQGMAAPCRIAGQQAWRLHVQPRSLTVRRAGGWGGGWEDDADDGRPTADVAAADGFGSSSADRNGGRSASKTRGSGGDGGGGGGGGGGWGSRRGGGETDDRRDRRRGGRGGGRDGGGGRGSFGGRDSRGPPDTIGGKPFYDAKPSKASYLSKLTGEVVYGVAPVLMAVQKGRRELHKLYVQDGMDLAKRKDASAVNKAVNAAHSLAIDVEYISKHDLNMMSDNRPHQGLLLDCGPLEWGNMETFPDAPEATDDGSLPPLWLALDEVYDPQNFGAVLRSAYFLGAAGVLACKRNSAPLSGVVAKASAGALEAMTVHSCSNLPKTLQQATSCGWQVLGAGTDGDAVSSSEFVMDKPTVLVVGNEGYGLRTNVRRACSGMIQVDSLPGMAVSEDASLVMGVDSLNVSVATGILMHGLLTSAKRR